MKERTLKKIMMETPMWEWKRLNGRGFYELMQCYRSSYIVDQDEAIRCFEIVKDYIKWFKKLK